jgi:hypothetical protein
MLPRFAILIARKEREGSALRGRHPGSQSETGTWRTESPAWAGPATVGLIGKIVIGISYYDKVAKSNNVSLFRFKNYGISNSG